MPRKDQTAEQNAPAAVKAATAPMKIDVNINSTQNYFDNPERARATVTLNDSFVIKGVRVMRGDNGLFVSMPARQGANGLYSEICHPITKEFARQFNASVLNEYQVYLAQQMEESNAVRHVIEPEALDNAAPEYNGPNDDMEFDEPDDGMEMGM